MIMSPPAKRRKGKKKSVSPSPSSSPASLSSPSSPPSPWSSQDTSPVLSRKRKHTDPSEKTQLAELERKLTEAYELFRQLAPSTPAQPDAAATLSAPRAEPASTSNQTTTTTSTSALAATTTSATSFELAYIPRRWDAHLTNIPLFEESARCCPYTWIAAVKTFIAAYQVPPECYRDIFTSRISGGATVFRHQLCGKGWNGPALIDQFLATFGSSTRVLTLLDGFGQCNSTREKFQYAKRIISLELPNTSQETVLTTFLNSISFADRVSLGSRYPDSTPNFSMDQIEKHLRKSDAGGLRSEQRSQIPSTTATGVVAVAAQRDGRPRCKHCKRPGHSVDKCYKVHPDKRPANRQDRKGQNRSTPPGEPVDAGKSGK